MRRMYSKKQIEKMAKTIAESVVKTLPPENLKYGYYIYDGEVTFKYVEEVPSDFSGLALLLADDGVYVMSYDDGSETSESYISTVGVYVTRNNDSANYDADGATKLNFAELTHSLAELDETLRGIVGDAIADAGVNGVACTQAQWDVIKTLFNKSLYFNYEGISMVKSFTDGLSQYCFGSFLNLFGYSLEFSFAEDENLLYAKYSEM